jgi:hypothetical protein
MGSHFEIPEGECWDGLDVCVDDVCGSPIQQTVYDIMFHPIAVRRKCE